MDLRMLRYLDERYDRDPYGQRRQENIPNGERRPIGFGQINYPQDNRYAHKEHDFEDDDFEELKRERFSPGAIIPGKRMEKSELMEKMCRSFKKELCDVMRYQEMSEWAEDEGMKEFAEGLTEIAYDEYTHATFLKENLRYMGFNFEQFEPEVRKLWKKVSRKYGG